MMCAAVKTTPCFEVSLGGCMIVVLKGLTAWLIGTPFMKLDGN